MGLRWGVFWAERELPVVYTEMDGGFNNGAAVRRNGLGVGAVSPALLSDLIRVCGLS